LSRRFPPPSDEANQHMNQVARGFVLVGRIAGPLLAHRDATFPNALQERLGHRLLRRAIVLVTPPHRTIHDNKPGLMLPGHRGPSGHIDVLPRQRVNQETSRSLAYIQNTDFSLVLRLNFSLRCEQEILNILGRFLSYHFEFFDVLKLPEVILVS